MRQERSQSEKPLTRVVLKSDLVYLYDYLMRYLAIMGGDNNSDVVCDVVCSTSAMQKNPNN